MQELIIDSDYAIHFSDYSKIPMYFTGRVIFRIKKIIVRVVYLEYGSESRTDGPAYWDEDIQRWCCTGLMHRDNGPAVIKKDGTRYWYSYGRLHSLIGPAQFRADGVKFWHIYARSYDTFESWFERLNPEDKVLALMNPDNYGDINETIRSCAELSKKVWRPSI